MKRWIFALLLIASNASAQQDIAALQTKFGHLIVRVIDTRTRSYGTGAVVVNPGPVVVATCFHVVQIDANDDSDHPLIVQDQDRFVTCPVEGVRAYPNEDIAFLLLDRRKCPNWTTYANRPQKFDWTPPTGLTNNAVIVFGYHQSKYLFGTSTTLSLDHQIVPLSTLAPDDQPLDLPYPINVVDLNNTTFRLLGGDSGGPTIGAGDALVGLAAGTVMMRAPDGSSPNAIAEFAVPVAESVPTTPREFTSTRIQPNPYGDASILRRSYVDARLGYLETLDLAANTPCGPGLSALINRYAGGNRSKLPASLVDTPESARGLLNATECESQYVAIRPLLIEQERQFLAAMSAEPTIATVSNYEFARDTAKPKIESLVAREASFKVADVLADACGKPRDEAAKRECLSEVYKQFAVADFGKKKVQQLDPKTKKLFVDELVDVSIADATRAIQISDDFRKLVNKPSMVTRDDLLNEQYRKSMELFSVALGDGTPAQASTRIKTLAKNAPLERASAKLQDLARNSWSTARLIGQDVLRRIDHH